MELSRLSLINLVAEFIVWRYWDNARALIRKAGCCHYLRAGTPELCGLKKYTPVWLPGNSQIDSIAGGRRKANAGMTPSFLGFLVCIGACCVDSLNLSDNGLVSLPKELEIQKSS